MIKKLIINADDFGMCEGNSLGILLAHEQGLVSSTTVMMNMPYALWALDKAKAYPNLGIGVHLTLTAGKPLLPGKKSYTDEEGNFLRPSAYEDEFPDGEPDEVYEEWTGTSDIYRFFDWKITPSSKNRRSAYFCSALTMVLSLRRKDSASS